VFGKQHDIVQAAVAAVQVGTLPVVLRGAPRPRPRPEELGRDDVRRRADAEVPKTEVPDCWADAGERCRRV
jgi:hypothetical protein